MAAGFDIVELQRPRELRRFVRVPAALYTGCPYWVPPLYGDEARSLDRRRNPVFEHTDAAFWVAVRDGEPIGRVAAFVNRRDNERRGRAAGRFGYIDFIDEREVSAGLLGAAERWAAGRGMEEIDGPLGAGHFDRNGILIEGFEELPTAISTYNHPYYADHIEACGFLKEIDYLEHRVEVPGEIDRRVARVARRVLERRGLRFWDAAKRAELVGRGREFFELINAAYAGLHDYVPLTGGEIDFLIGQFFSFIDPRFVKVVEDAAGRIVAAGVAMPSASRGLQAARGKLWPLGWWKLFRALRREEVLDLYLIAVRPELRGAGINAAVMHAVHEEAARRGMRWAETNGELETNARVLSLWRNYPHRTHKRRRIYTKRLGEHPARAGHHANILSVNEGEPQPGAW